MTTGGFAFIMEDMNQKIPERRAFLNAARSKNRRITIGFAGVADFRSFIGQEYFAGIVKAVNDYDINLINMAGATKYSLFDDIDFISHYLKNFKFMKKPLVDGMVTWASSLCNYMSDDKVLQLFSSLKPMPMVDIGYMDIPDIPSIRIDNTLSITSIINHLVIDHGYKKLAFIGSRISKPHQNRLECYKEELKKHNIEIQPDSIYMTDSLEEEDIAACVSKLLKKFSIENHELDAIVTSSDIIASIVMEKLDDAGFSVPNDIRITGFNNQYASLSARSPITTVDLEYFKRGYTAVELLIDRIMAPEKRFETIHLPTRLILRQSCGCFEKSISDIANSSSRRDFMTNLISDTDSESELRHALLSEISRIFENETEKEKNELVEAIFHDIYVQTEKSETLRWFQKLLQSHRKRHIIPSMDYQIIINRLRCIIHPLVFENMEQHNHLEDIFHSMRILISVFNEYDKLAQRESSYLFNNLSRIAITFASAQNGKEIQDALRFQLDEMEIPGLILCLSDNMSPELEPATVEMVIPEPETYQLTHSKIMDPALISPKLFPQNRRFTYMLETLHHGNNFFGYAFFEMGSNNVAMYDAVKTLLSNALFSVYSKEGRTARKSLRLSNNQIAGILNISNESALEQTDEQGLSIQKITDYLIEHINEMTNLDEMSEALNISKSHLSRVVKQLTGFTVQTLHEKIKIEWAKNMLSKSDLRMNEIALRLGFQNQNYFSNVFKKCTGLSPSAWLKNK